MSALRHEAIALLLMGGMRPCEISQVTGSTWPFIRGIRRQLGLPPFPSGRKVGEVWKPDIIQKVREMTARGISHREIARSLGLQSQRISQLMAPLKHRARAAVNRAVRRGDLLRPDKCQDCGEPCQPEAHHADYTKPLTIEWLCVACHGTRRRSLTASEVAA